MIIKSTVRKLWSNIYKSVDLFLDSEGVSLGQKSEN